MPNRSLIILLLVSAIAIEADCQTQNFWQTLAEVGFQTYRDKNGALVETPNFSKNLKSWDGKRIRLKGYVIPVNEVGDQNKFMLSSMPFNVCYFCGAAGPETVVEVEAMEPFHFSTKPIWIEGVLYLNTEDPDHHMYILKSAHLLSVPSADGRPRIDVNSK